MPKCFQCKTDMGQGGIVQENGTILCLNCDSQLNGALPLTDVMLSGTVSKSKKRKMWIIGAVVFTVAVVTGTYSELNTRSKAAASAREEERNRDFTNKTSEIMEKGVVFYDLGLDDATFYKASTDYTKTLAVLELKLTSAEREHSMWKCLFAAYVYQSRAQIYWERSHDVEFEPGNKYEKYYQFKAAAVIAGASATNIWRSISKPDAPWRTECLICKAKGEIVCLDCKTITLPLLKNRYPCFACNDTKKVRCFACRGQGKWLPWSWKGTDDLELGHIQQLPKQSLLDN